MEILKAISRFFGGAFFGLGLTLLLFGLLTGFVINDVDLLRGKGEEVVVGMFSSPEFLEGLIQQGSPGKTLEEVKAECNEAPDKEGCDILRQMEDDPRAFVQNNPNFAKGVEDLNKQIDSLADGVKGFEFVSMAVIAGSIVLIVLGVLFIFLGNMDWRKAGYSICVKGAVTTGLAAVYYKVIQGLLAGDVLASKIKLGAVPLGPIKDLLSGWINPVFNKIFIINLGLAVIFILSAIGFYFLKKKDLKKGNKGK